MGVTYDVIVLNKCKATNNVSMSCVCSRHLEAFFYISCESLVITILGLYVFSVI